MADKQAGQWSLDTRKLRVERIQQALDRNDPVDAMIEAEELLDQSPRDAEGLFLLGEALLEGGDSETALLAFEQACSVDNPHPDAIIGLAAARFETCNLVAALESAREAVRQHPDSAEAHFTLALALERLHGETRPEARSESMRAFVAANRLDAVSYPFPLVRTAQQWEEAVEEALTRIPVALRSFWADVPITLEDAPAIAELRDLDPPVSPMVLGLYEGNLDEGASPWDHRPERLRLFRANLAHAADVHALIDRIAVTLEQEALAWLGLTNEQLHPH
jgi:predicted Zn-dependent protease with MMP-like domain